MLSEITALPRVNKSPPKVATQVEQGPGSSVTACMKYEPALKNLTMQRQSPRLHAAKFFTELAQSILDDDPRAVATKFVGEVFV